MEKSEEQKTRKEEQEEFFTHLAIVTTDASARLSVVLEMPDELITWLPVEENGQTHTFGH